MLTISMVMVMSVSCDIPRWHWQCDRLKELWLKWGRCPFSDQKALQFPRGCKSFEAETSHGRPWLKTKQKTASLVEKGQKMNKKWKRAAQAKKGNTSLQALHNSWSPSHLTLFHLLAPHCGKQASERNQFKQKQFATIYLISVDIP